MLRPSMLVELGRGAYYYKILRGNVPSTQSGRFGQFRVLGGHPVLRRITPPLSYSVMSTFVEFLLRLRWTIEIGYTSLIKRVINYVY